MLEMQEELIVKEPVETDCWRFCPEENGTSARPSYEGQQLLCEAWKPRHLYQLAARLPSSIVVPSA